MVISRMGLPSRSGIGIGVSNIRNGAHSHCCCWEVAFVEDEDVVEALA